MLNLLQLLKDPIEHEAEKAIGSWMENKNNYNKLMRVLGRSTYSRKKIIKFYQIYKFTAEIEKEN